MKMKKKKLFWPEMTQFLKMIGYTLEYTLPGYTCYCDQTWQANTIRHSNTIKYLSHMAKFNHACMLLTFNKIKRIYYDHIMQNHK